jgi:ketoreductase RED2
MTHRFGTSLKGAELASSLTGKVALVTGSSSGIGEATARTLSDAGAIVAVNSRASVTQGEAIAAELPGSIYVQADIADPEQTRRMVEEVVTRLGRLDILVNNAGTTVVIPHKDFDSVTPEVWRKILDVNVIGTWQVTAAAIPHLRANGDGCVINVSSRAGERASGSSIPYAASKAAVSHLTRLIAAVVAPEVRVNAVAPGLIDTPWTADFDEVRALVRAGSPMRRTGTPQDVADAILGLVVSRYVTGEVLLVDGGVSL